MDQNLIRIKDRVLIILGVALALLTSCLLYQYYGTTSLVLIAGVFIIYCAIKKRYVVTADHPQALQAESVSRVTSNVTLLIAVTLALIVMYAAQLILFRDPVEDLIPYYLLLLAGLAIVAVALWIVPVPALPIHSPQLSKVRVRWPLLIASIALAVYAGVRAMQVTTVAEQFAVWIMSISTLALAFVRTKPLAEDRLRRWEWVLIIALFIGALLVRGVDISNVPYVIDGDEAHFAEIGTSTISAGWDSSPFRTSFDSYTRLQSDLIAFCVSILGVSVSAARIPSVILGSLTIPAIYLLGRELYNWKLGFAAALFTLGWAFHAQFSRLGLNQVGDPCFGAFAFFFLVRGIRRGSAVDYALSGIMLALSQMFYLAGTQYLLIMIAFVLWMGWRQRDLIRPQWGRILIAPVATLIIYFPRLYYLWQQQEPMFGHMQPNIVANGALSQAFRAGTGWSLIFYQIQQSFLALVSIHDKMKWYGTSSNLLSPVGGPLLLVGTVAALYMLRRYPMIALSVGWSFSAVFLGATLTDMSPSYQRYVAGVPGFALLVGLGIIALSNCASTLLTPRNVNRLVQTLGVIAGGASLIFYVNLYIPERGYLDNPGVWTGEHAALDMRDQLKAGRDVYLIDYFPTGLDAKSSVIKYLMAGLPYHSIDTEESIAEGLGALADPDARIALYVAPRRMDDLKAYLEEFVPLRVTGVEEFDFDGNPAYYEVLVN